MQDVTDQNKSKDLGLALKLDVKAHQRQSGHTDCKAQVVVLIQGRRDASGRNLCSHSNHVHGSPEALHNTFSFTI
jgi:hypothetical protein